MSKNCQLLHKTFDYSIPESQKILLDCAHGRIPVHFGNVSDINNFSTYYFYIKELLDTHAKFVKRIGYEPQEKFIPQMNDYRTSLLMAGSGSLHLHVDRGIGPMVCTLVCAIPMIVNHKPAICESTGGQLGVFDEKNHDFVTARIGSTFAFDAEKSHIWISNSYWLLLNTIVTMDSFKSVS